MTEVVTKTELDEAFAMFYGMAASIKDLASPEPEMTEAERVGAAKGVFLKAIDAEMATQLDACVKCGACAQACQYSIGTNDPKYTPVRKLELLKRVYDRELSPLRCRPGGGGSALPGGAGPVCNHLMNRLCARPACASRQ